MEAARPGADLLPIGSASLVTELRKGEEKQAQCIEDRMHRHRDQNRSTPFVGKGETNRQDKQRRKGGKMRVHRGKQQSGKDQTANPADIATQHAIKKKTENEF